MPYLLHPHLAYLLQNSDGHFEVADVKCRQGQSEITKVAIAELRKRVASRTFSYLRACTHTPVEWSMFDRISDVALTFFEVVEAVISQLEH